ncbi:isochorismate synthase [Nocardia transvalensis]|uniref:isochorismate synthase n=1 Tax=Nocardia transvalensis TaxID=37333 RepID=UPI0018941B16|nr:chorismate-binding protein [Nocardia transvalensis]MBF6329407.1 chorismate-binding protein [Nocardia transvalensis]
MISISADPAFVLSRPYRTVCAWGVGRVFSSVAEAAAALRGGEVTHVVGALPFAPDAPAALWAPQSITVRDNDIRPVAPATPPTFEFEAAIPDPETHVRRVAEAVRLLADPTHPIRKVVLARAIRARSAVPVRAHDILEQLVATDPMGNGFLVDLSAAGAPFTGRHLVGSSPEVLIRRDGTEVLSHPLAGSARRVTGDERADRAVAADLLTSSKDRHEHGYVVEQVGAVLRDRCADVHTPAPELTSTPEMWHIGTPITAAVRADGPSALELAAALHPTPAICGTPTDEAARLIAELEGDRGFYAGAIGWCDARGDGEWMVSIRCAELAADGRSLLAHAGGGIVAESDPAAELAETTGKFQRILRPLGIAELPITVA